MNSATGRASVAPSTTKGIDPPGRRLDADLGDPQGLADDRGVGEQHVALAFVGLLRARS